MRLTTLFVIMCLGGGLASASKANAQPYSYTTKTSAKSATQPDLEKRTGAKIPDTESYSFKVIGHAYPLIKQLEPIISGDDLVVFTGDVVRHGCTDWDEFRAIAGTTSEYHVAAGNHDKAIHCPENWEDDRLFYEFRKNGDQFIILDTVEYNWNIRWKQLQDLEIAFQKPARNRFIFMHNAIHYNDPDFQTWLPNSFVGHSAWLTFTEDVRPIFESREDVYVFFGDYGNRTNGHHDQEENGVRYIGAGLSARDGAVESGYSSVGVGKDGRVWIVHKNLNCDIADEDKTSIHLCE